MDLHDVPALVLRSSLCLGACGLGHFELCLAFDVGKISTSKVSTQDNRFQYTQVISKSVLRMSLL